MMKNWKWIFFMFAPLMFGCYDEGTLSPSGEPELIYGKYTIPQGDHDYDTKIVDFYEKYNSLFLYKFTTKDFGWTVNGNMSWDPVRDTLKGMGYKYDARPADEDYVGKQLELLEQKFLKYFSEVWIKDLLPQRILLCSVLNQVGIVKENSVIINEFTALHVHPGYYHIAVNWGDEAILTMTAADRNTFKNDVCKVFFRNLYPYGGGGPLDQSEVFIAKSVYSDDITSANMYEHGILNYNHRTSPGEDWYDYICMIITTPLAALEGEGGLMNPAVDVKGMIRAKYDIMADFFKSKYNIDLKAIGNDVE